MMKLDMVVMIHATCLTAAKPEGPAKIWNAKTRATKDNTNIDHWDSCRVCASDPAKKDTVDEDISDVRKRSNAGENKRDGPGKENSLHFIFIISRFARLRSNRVKKAWGPGRLYTLGLDRVRR